MATTAERLAGWASDITFTDVPAPVLDLARTQRRSVVAAVAASTGDDAARRVLSAVAGWARPGRCPLPGLPAPVAADDAIYAGTALSIALDFDDYQCFAHTGHSAVLVPLLLAVETGASGPDQLAAQVVAGEVEARLGAAALLGPLNGQLWSFVHAAGAALAAGRLLGLDATTLAHALALALYQAPRPTVPGFMAPDSKLLTAAEPALIGVRAARLAAAGVTGPLDILDHPQGFLAAFAYAPLPALLGGLGDGWATRTLCIKRYPGCAYVDTTIDALLELGPLDPGAIDCVRVDANILTCEMDAMSRQYATRGAPTPVTMNFSIPWNVAAAVMAGQLTPAETNTAWLREHDAQLTDLASRVELRHDWGLTLRTAEAMMPLLPVRAITSGTNRLQLLGAVRRVRREHAGLRGGAADAIALVRAMTDADAASARRALGVHALWSADALDDFAMTFPARVRVRLRSGRELEAGVDIPAGGAGNRVATPELVSREKLAQTGAGVWGVGGTERIAKSIDTDDDELGLLLGAVR